MNIDKELLGWLDEQVKKGNFANRSAGIRRCIRITKKVYEHGTPEEIIKFFNIRKT